MVKAQGIVYILIESNEPTDSNILVTRLEKLEISMSDKIFFLRN